MKPLAPEQRVIRTAFLTVLVCSVAILAMYYVYFVCKQYWRWYCYVPVFVPHFVLLCLLGLSFAMRRQSRILAQLGFFVSICGLIFVSMGCL